MRRAFLFLVAVSLATSSFATVPRASALEVSSPGFDPLPETRIGVSEDLAPFERSAPSLLGQALRQAYEQPGSSNTSGLAGFSSFDPAPDLEGSVSGPRRWNRSSYVSNPITEVDRDDRNESATPGNPARTEEEPIAHGGFNRKRLCRALSAGLGRTAPGRAALALAGRAPRLFLTVLEWGVVETAGITIGRRVVIGSYRPESGPNYIEIAKDFGARAFNLGSLYNKLSPAAAQAANIRFLDRAVARRATIYLSTDPSIVNPKSALGKEIQYLQSKGLNVVRDAETGLWRFVHAK